MAIITVTDLRTISPGIDTKQAQAMIKDAIAQAILAAPCLQHEDQLTDAQRAQYKAILRGAIIRWDDAGSGGMVTMQDTAGPFGQTITTDSTRAHKGLFWPSEIELLRRICGTGRQNGTIDTAPPRPAHNPWTCPGCWTPAPGLS